MPKGEQKWVAVVLLRDDGIDPGKSPSEGNYFHEDELRGLLEKVDLSVSGLTFELRDLVRVD